jgi:hypothetical protein
MQQSTVAPVKPDDWSETDIAKDAANQFFNNSKKPNGMLQTIGKEAVKAIII